MEAAHDVTPSENEIRFNFFTPAQKGPEQRSRHHCGSMAGELLCHAELCAHQGHREQQTLSGVNLTEHSHSTAPHPLRAPRAQPIGSAVGWQQAPKGPDPQRLKSGSTRTWGLEAAGGGGFYSPLRERLGEECWLLGVLTAAPAMAELNSFSREESPLPLGTQKGKRDVKLPARPAATLRSSDPQLPPSSSPRWDLAAAHSRAHGPTAQRGGQSALGWELRTQRPLGQTAPAAPCPPAPHRVPHRRLVVLQEILGHVSFALKTNAGAHGAGRRRGSPGSSWLQAVPAALLGASSPSPLPRDGHSRAPKAFSSSQAPG